MTSMSDETTHSRWLAALRRPLPGGVRWLIGLSVAAGLFVVWQSNRALQQRAVVAEIERFHPHVTYDYQFEGDARPPGPQWLRAWFGDDFFADISSIRILTDGVDNDTVAVIATLPQLRQLVLVADAMDDQGFLRLAAAAHLEELDITSATVTDAGLAQVATLRGLSRLRIAAPKITDAGLIPLEDLPGLTSVHLISTDVTREGVERLRAALPQCVVVVSPEPSKRL
jgi:hypothetical protein